MQVAPAWYGQEKIVVSFRIFVVLVLKSTHYLGSQIKSMLLSRITSQLLFGLELSVYYIFYLQVGGDG